jgi:hypothetical protein
MTAPDVLLNSFEKGFLNLAEDLGPEYLDPLVAMRLASYLRSVAGTVYTMGYQDAQPCSGTCPNCTGESSC